MTSLCSETLLELTKKQTAQPCCYWPAWFLLTMVWTIQKIKKIKKEITQLAFSAATHICNRERGHTVWTRRLLTQSGLSKRDLCHGWQAWGYPGQLPAGHKEKEHVAVYEASLLPSCWQGELYSKVQSLGRAKKNLTCCPHLSCL